MPCPFIIASPLRYFNSSSAVIRLVVLIDVKCSFTLSFVEAGQISGANVLFVMIIP